MQLVAGGARAQLRKSLRSTARVLAACGSALPLALSTVLYVAEAAAAGGGLGALAQCVTTWCAGRQLGGAPAREKARQREAAAAGAGGDSGSESESTEVGQAEGETEAEEDSEVEAERQFPLGPAAHRAPRLRLPETMPPVLVLVVPALPRGALVEVEVAAVTSAAAGEGGGLRALSASGADAAAVSAAVASCAWSCTAAAWGPAADVDGLVEAVAEHAGRCGLGAARSIREQLRVRAFVTPNLWPRASDVEARLCAAMGADGIAISTVPVAHLALGERGCDKDGAAWGAADVQSGLAVIISCF